jgi:hypothetical protein
VRFPDVDVKELDLLLAGLVEIAEAHGPQDEGRSREAPEHQGHGLAAAEAREADPAGSRCLREIEVGGNVTYPGRLRPVRRVPRDGLVGIPDGPARPPLRSRPLGSTWGAHLPRSLMATSGDFRCSSMATTR